MSPVTFILDASSFQGAVNWAAVDTVVDAGFEKITEGVNYVNPYWPAAKQALTARARATGLVPGGYLFLDASESGAAQADWFAQHAGDLTGFAVGVDLERAPNGNPTMTIARDCVARLRHHYPGHPVGLYAPHWFTGGQDLGFGDWLWASGYVSGSAAATSLYRLVTEGYWAAYGGRNPDVLQFTSSAVVPGVAGPCDCSAYRGSLTQLKALLLPKPKPAPKPPAPPVPQEEDMADSLTIDLVPGQPEILPVWAGAAAGEPVAYAYAALMLAATETVKVAVTFTGSGVTSTQDITVSAGAAVPVAPAKPLTWGQVGTVTLLRALEGTSPGGSAPVAAPEPCVRAVLTRWK